MNNGELSSIPANNVTFHRSILQASLPFGNRRAEQDILQNLVRYPGANPTGCLVAGPPGIGKTSLCALLADFARQSGYLVLSESSRPELADKPLGNFHSLLREGTNDESTSLEVRGQLKYEEWMDRFFAIPSSGPRRAGALAGGGIDGVADLALAAGMVPFGLAAKAAAGGMAARFAQEENVHTHAAVDMEGVAADYVSYLTDSGPVLLVLDDFHWMDSSSVRALDRVIRRRHAQQLILVINFRPLELQVQIAGHYLVQQLYEKGFGQLELEPLAEHALVESLTRAGKGLDMTTIRAIAHESEGNPLLAEWDFQVKSRQLRSASSSNAIDKSVGGKQRRALSNRISALSRLGRRYLEIGSSIGTRFDLRDVHDVLRELAEGIQISLMSESHNLASMLDVGTIQDELERLELASVHSRPRIGLRFRHPLIRELIYSEIPAGIREMIHGLISKVLTSRHSDGQTVEAAEVGRHLRLANELQSATTWFLRAAGESCRLQNYTHCAEQTVAASECISSEDFPWRWSATKRQRIRFQLLVRVAECFHRNGDFERARAAALEVASAEEPNCPPHIRAQALYWLGKIEYFIGNDYAAVTHYERAMNRFRQSASQGCMARTATALAASLVQVGELEAALRHFRVGLHFAEELEEVRPDIAVEVYQHSSMVLSEPESIRNLERAIELTQERTWYRQEGMLWQNLGVSYYHEGNAAEAEIAFKRARELHLRSGAFELVYTLNSLGVMSLLEEKFSEAEKYFDQANERLVANFDRIWVANNRAILSALTGNVERGLALLVEQIPSIKRHSDPIIREYSYYNLGLLYLMAGRLKDAKYFLLRSRPSVDSKRRPFAHARRLTALATLYSLEGASRRSDLLRRLSNELLGSTGATEASQPASRFIYCHLRAYH